MMLLRMKKLFILTFILSVFLFNVPTASAYGGGGVTPPIYDNPHTPVTIVCQTVTRELPFNRQISYPSCKAVRNPEFKEYNNDFQQRIRDFVSRVRNGGN